MTGPIDEPTPAGPRAPQWGAPSTAGQPPRRVLWDSDPTDPGDPTGPGDPADYGPQEVPAGPAGAGYGPGGPAGADYGPAGPAATGHGPAGAAGAGYGPAGPAVAGYGPAGAAGAGYGPGGPAVAGYGHAGPLGSAPPPPAPGGDVPGPLHPAPRVGPTRLALIAVAAVVAVVVGAVVILTTRSGTPVVAAPTATGFPAADPGYGSAGDPTETPTDEVTTDPPTPTDDPTTDPADPSAVPDGYTLTSGPAGIEVPVPSDWPVGAGAVPTNMQADDPTVPGRFLRFGGDPATTTDPLPGVEYAEAHTPSIRAGYHRLRLEPVSYGNSGSAADWEFTFVKDGETRHAYGRYWYDNGTIYVVYLSAPDSDWAASSELLDVVLNHSTA